MKTTKRPSYIVHWRDIETPVAPHGLGEMFGFASELAHASGMTHLRVAHLRIPPGLRAYPPVAMRDDEVFFIVLEGAPDFWADGYVHRLREGDGVWLNARTGIGHSVLNNCDADVCILAFTEGQRHTSRAVHPVDKAANENLASLGKLWTDPPKRKRGPHDGQTDAMRGAPSPKGARKKTLPDFAMNWRDILEKDEGGYPGSSEKHGIDARFGRRARFSRIGVHLEILKPGRRTSRPHAERDEEEFVYVVSGSVDAWNDGYITKMDAGDFIGWEAGTGITHVIMNNSDEDAVLIVGGEAGRRNNQFWYPFHRAYNKEIGALYWADHPVPKLGPHDGLSDAMRAAAKAKPKPKAKAKKSAPAKKQKAKKQTAKKQKPKSRR